VPDPSRYTTITNCSNGSWDPVTRTLVANAFTTKFATLGLDASYLDEYTAGLEIGFSRDYSMRFNVIRKFDFPGTKTYDLAEPFAAYTDLRTYADPGPNGITGDADDTGETLYIWSVPESYPTQGQTDDLINNLRDGEGRDQFTAYEVTFAKQYSNGWSALAGFTMDMAHENDNDSENPNDLFYRFDEPYWRQAIKLNGTYQLPWGLMWAGTFSAQSGNWYDRTVERENALGDDVEVTIERRVGRHPWVNLWDNRISKRFQIGDRHSIEGTFDLFNTLNVNTITSWEEASGRNYHRPSNWIVPRIFKLGVKYKF
jgi:hypothetical protein